MKKRILVILKGFPRISETFILQELLSLEEDFELTLYSLKGARESFTHPRVKDLRAQVFYQDPGLDYHDPAQLELCLSRLPKIDLVYSHFLHDPSLFGLTVANALKVPLICSGHAVDIYTTPIEQLEKVISKARKVFICHSHGHEYLASHFPSYKNRLLLLPHGIDCKQFDHFPQERKKNHFLSVGRLVQKKGYAEILNALAKFKAAGNQFHYHIVGEGALRPELDELIARLNLQSEVSLLGARESGEVKLLYQTCSLFLLAPTPTESGDRDGIPNVLLEAMASSIPVICKSLPGLENIVIPGETAQVFAEGVSDLFSELVNFAQRDAASIAAQCKRAKQLVTASFDASIHLAELKKLLGQELS